MKVSPSDYARTNRRWHGEIPVTSFDRLVHEVSADTEVVDVQLAFSRDENDRIRMRGHASVTAEVGCHRCSDSVATSIRADIDARIVRSDEIARGLAQDTDVIVVTDNPVSVIDLIEDDLIMSIPWRVCEQEEDCPNLDEVDDGETQDGDLDDSMQRPFANLRQLLNDR